MKRRKAERKGPGHALQSLQREPHRLTPVLSECEPLSRLIIESAHQGVWLLDERERTTYVNPAMAAMLGYTIDEMVGRFVYDFMDSRGRALAKRRLAKHRHNISEQLDARLRTKEGREVWFIVTAKPIHDARGRYCGTLGLLTDITARRHAEEALRRTAILREALHRISLLLHSSLDFETIIRRLVAEGVTLLGSETGAVALRDRGGWTVKYVHGLPLKLIGTRWQDQQLPHALLALRSEKVVAVEDALRDKRVNRAAMLLFDIQAVLVAPLIVRSKRLGVIFFNYHTKPHPFTHVEGDFCRLLADAAAIALDNAFNFRRRERAERSLRALTQKLEQRVRRRTVQLERANCSLREAEDRFRQMADCVPEVFWLSNASLTKVLYVSPAFEKISGRSCQLLRDNPRLRLELIHPADRERIKSQLRKHLKLRNGPAQFDFRICRPDGSIRWLQDRRWPVFDKAGRVYRWAGITHDVTERKQLQNEVERISEMERQHLGQDLHDGLAQRMAGLAMRGDALAKRLRTLGIDEASEAARIAGLAREAADLTHDLAGTLYPASLKASGLPSALRQLARLVAKIFPVDCRFRNRNGKPLHDANLERQLYRIVQEGAFNAAKHSGGKRVHILLKQSKRFLEVVVKDDGVSGWTTKPASGQIGLNMIKYRAEMIGATLKIETQPGRGTTLACTLRAPRQ